MTNNRPSSFENGILPRYEACHNNKSAIKIKYTEIKDTLNSLRNEYLKEERTYMETRLDKIARTCTLGLKLKKNPKLFNRFIEDNWWQDKPSPPNRKKIKKAVFYALRWVFDRNKNGYKNASMYWRAIGPYLEDGCKPEDFPELIRKQGGLRKMAKENAAKKKEKRQSSKPDSSTSKKSMPFNKSSITFEGDTSYLNNLKRAKRFIIDATMNITDNQLNMTIHDCD